VLASSARYNASFREIQRLLRNFSMRGGHGGGGFHGGGGGFGGGHGGYHGGFGGGHGGYGGGHIGGGGEVTGPVTGTTCSQMCAMSLLLEFIFSSSPLDLLKHSTDGSMKVPRSMKKL
jgi:hypothetical protein